MKEKISKEDIKKLISNLLEKDISLGYKFLQEGKLEELYDLVESDIIKVNRRIKNNPEDEFSKRSLERLNDLEMDLILYMEDYMKDMDIDEYLEMEATYNGTI